MTDVECRLLVEVAHCLQDLLGDLIDLQPPATQERLADLQVRMIEALRAACNA